MTLRKNQAKEMLNTLSIMSTHEANECKTRMDASTQAFRTYYQQEGAAQYNLNEALDALVTLTDRSQKTVHSEQQKSFLELSNKPTLALYMGFPDQLIPSDIKNQRTSAFSATSRERSQSRPTQGGQRNQKINFQTTRRRPNQGSRAPPMKRGNPQCTKDQKYTRIIEPLKFFHELCEMENNLLILFNKLNSSQYTSGIVNLSNYTLQDAEISVLSKGLGFCPTPGTPDIGDIIQDLDSFKRKTRIELFFTDPNQGSKTESIHSGGPFEHRSFKLNSTFNPVGPFQLKSMFHSIKQDLHRQKYKEPKEEKL